MIVFFTPFPVRLNLTIALVITRAILRRVALTAGSDGTDRNSGTTHRTFRQCVWIGDEYANAASVSGGGRFERTTIGIDCRVAM